jgi:hypothetical protein
MLIRNGASHRLNGNFFQRLKFLARKSDLVPGMGSHSRHFQKSKTENFFCRLVMGANSVLLFEDKNLMILAIRLAAGDGN